MNIELAISGKAGKYGNESIGIDDDSLKNRLYNQSQHDSDVESRLSIDFERIGDDGYALYHYVKPYNVAQKMTREEEENNCKHGRAGSYFALTIRLKNCYCKEVKFMYSLLEDMFKKYIMNNVLSNSDTDNYWVYKVSTLTEAQPILDEIAQEVRRIINDKSAIIKPLSVYQIEKPSGNIRKMDFEEIEEIKCHDFLMTGGKLYISPNYKKTSQVKPNGSNAKITSHNLVHNNGESINGETSSVDSHEKFFSNNISRHEIREPDQDGDNDFLSEEFKFKIGRIFNFDIFKKGNDKKCKNVIKYAISISVVFVIIIFLSNLFSHKKEDDIVVEDTVQTAEVAQDDEIGSGNFEKKLSDGALKQPELSRVTRLDIKGSSFFVREECYKITAIAGDGKKESRAAGVGLFDTDADEDDVWIHQDSSICIIYIPKDFREDTVLVSYRYMIDGEEVVCSRSVCVTDKPIAASVNKKK